MVTNKMINKSIRWLKRNGRPLEVARWGYLFEGKPNESVITCLMAYQNEDGGFGHAIEPDFWVPNSSPMATWTAAKILWEVNASSAEGIIKSMITYLTHTLDEKTGMWESVIPETNDYPHAPWWNWYECVQENWSFNPSVELAAYLVHWSRTERDKDLGWNVINKAVDHLMRVNEMDKHELNNYQQLLRVMGSYASVFMDRTGYSLSEVEVQVNTLVMTCVDRDVSNWLTGYRPLPLDFISSPTDDLCSDLNELVKENLQLYKEQLSEQGTWDIAWEWQSYKEEFAVARRYWMGILIVERYKKLRSFNYLDQTIIE